MKKVYFAGSIRGGQNDTALYHKIIQYIQKTDIVLTEHVGDVHHSTIEQDSDTNIYTQDTTWIQQCDCIIAECTNPSLGVGYELAYGEKYQKPIYILYRPLQTQLSAMLKGNAYFKIYRYETLDEVYPIIDAILQKKQS